MSEPFLGEVRMFGGNFPPRGWLFCDGQLLPINSNQALFSLLGTIYGGDGRTTFALPQLKGRIPVGTGEGPGLSRKSIGERAGAERVSLTAAEIPAHSHPISASTNASSNAQSPVDAATGDTGAALYGEPTSPPVAMSSDGVANAGGSQLHENMAPFQAVSFIIAITGTFPSRS